MRDIAATTPAAAAACAHGEPRGCTSCPLCARYGCARCLQVDEPDVGPTKVSTVRMPAGLHAQAMAKAKAEDRQFSQAIRALVRAWVAE